LSTEIAAAPPDILVVRPIPETSRPASTPSLDAIYQGLPVTVHADFRLPVEAKNIGPIRAGTLRPPRCAITPRIDIERER